VIAHPERVFVVARDFSLRQNPVIMALGTTQPLPVGIGALPEGNGAGV